MALPAKKLSPEEQEYYRNRVQGTKPVDGVQRPSDANLELLTDNQAGEEVEGEEYTPPDLQLVEDEDEDQPQINGDDIEQRTKGKQLTPQQQIQQGEVPEYRSQDVFRPAGANEVQPGGPAVELKEKPVQDTREGPKKTIGDTAKTEAKDKAKKAVSSEAKNLAKNIASKFSSAALKEASAAAGSWIVANIGPIILVIIGIVVIVVAIIFIVRALQTPNAMGSSPVQQADILSDYQLIKTVLSLSDPVAFENMLANNKTQLLTEISNFEQTIQSKFAGDSRVAPTIAKLDQAKAKINAYTKVDAAAAAEIKQLITEAVKPWTVDLNPNLLILPLGKGYSADSVTAGGQYLRNRGSYIHRGIDIMVPIGRPYYAAASGKIVYLKDDLADGGPNEDLYHNRRKPDNGGFGNAIVVEITAGPWQGYYWELHHLKQGSAHALGLNTGTMVQQGQLIGQTGHNGMSTGPHMHFQVDKSVCRRFLVLARPCGDTGSTIDPKIALGWKECPKGLPCNP